MPSAQVSRTEMAHAVRVGVVNNGVDMTISRFDTPVMLLLLTRTPARMHHMLAPCPHLHLHLHRCHRSHACMPPPPLHSRRHRTLNPRVPAPCRAKLHPRRLLGLRALEPRKCVQDNTPSLEQSRRVRAC